MLKAGTILHLAKYSDQVATASRNGMHLFAFKSIYGNLENYEIMA